MEFDKFSGDDAPMLHNLMQAARYWRQLDAAVKKLLPANLHAHFRVSCIQDGVLLLSVSGPMAAARLNMLLPTLLPALQELDEHIAAVRTQVRPENPEPVHQKNFRIQNSALDCFERTAAQLEHHPGLAEAMRNLVKNHRF